MRSTCLIGNIVEFSWQARLSEHLGIMTIHLLKPITSLFFNSNLTLTIIISLCKTIYLCLPERHKEEILYLKLKSYFEELKYSKNLIKDYVLFEMLLLAELGYSLDLDQCAANNSRENLIYISPKSGKAVSEEAGKGYENMLFSMPKFFTENVESPSDDELKNALQITGYFIKKFILKSKNKNLVHRDRLLHGL